MNQCLSMKRSIIDRHELGQGRGRHVTLIMSHRKTHIRPLGKTSTRHPRSVLQRAAGGARWTGVIVAALLLLLAFRPGRLLASSLPEYDEIAPTVAFWKSVYSKYTLNDAIIHDKRHPFIIYQVVKLRPERSGADRRRNRRSIARVKKKYRRILSRLARIGRPVRAEEKRVFALFGAMASRSTFRAAVGDVRFQLGQKDRFARGIVRSGAWLARMKKIFRRQGVPEDLVYLAHVESSFNPRAYSKFGAAGIWQFTRSTGRMYMDVGYVVDERRDPLASSRAAARLLAYNYKMLRNWPLAVTAYNHGLGGMLKAVKKEGGDYCRIYREYRGPGFGFASRNFYSEFLAARKVAKRYRRFFSNLVLDRAENTFEFPLPAYAAITDLVDHFAVELAHLRRLNPALREPVFDGRKYVPRGYRLRLPERVGRMASLAAGMGGDMLHSHQRPSSYHRVRRGDTVSRIARLYGVGTRDLIRANSLNRRGTIYAGQRLRLPGGVADRVVVLSAGAKFAPPIMVAALDLKAPSPGAVKSVVGIDLPLPPGLIPVDGKGDKSAPAAKFLDTIMLAQAHLPPGLEDDPSGWILPRSERFYQAALRRDEFVYPDRLNSVEVEQNLAVIKIVERGGKRFGLIRVAAAETLGHYAQWLGIPTSRLRRVNKLRYGRPIQVNQQLTIPLAKTYETSFVEKRYDFHRELLEDFFASWRIENLRPYRIKSGDSIWVLCSREFDLPFWLIHRFNQDLDPLKMRPRQEIMVPVVVRRDLHYAGLSGGVRAAGI